MSARVQQAWQRARRRRWWSSALIGLPLAVAATALALRVAGFNPAAVVLLLALLVVSNLVARRLQR